jgi:hypothetical protein
MPLLMTVRTSDLSAYKSLNLKLGYESGLSDTPTDPNDSAPFLRQLEPTLPAATSTPPKSIQIPSQLQFQSNLLEQDLDMQNAMKDFDSFEEDSGPSQRPCELLLLKTELEKTLSCSFSFIPPCTHTAGTSFCPSSTSFACLRLPCSFG